MLKPSHSPTTKPRASCWATPEQELLLRAALLTGPAALEAWDAWHTGTDFDTVDGASFRLLPLLYRNLNEHGVQHPLMGRLKGLHRRSWYRNQLLLAPATMLIQRLHDAGIPTLLLKGAALVSGYYADFGVRPMDDFDILVPTAQAAAAYRILQEAGWSSNLHLATLSPGYQDLKHGDLFSDGLGHQVDLHWHVLHRVYSTVGDDDFWQARQPVQFGEVMTSMLHPADQLLHVCVHGTVCHGVPQLRWAADAMAILRKCPELDWGRLVMQARRHGVVLPVRETLRYLKQTLAPEIPLAVLEELHCLTISATERRVFRSVSTAAHEQGPLLIGWSILHTYGGLLSSRAGWRTITDLARDYQRRYAVKHLWQVFFHLGGRWLRKLAPLAASAQQGSA